MSVLLSQGTVVVQDLGAISITRKGILRPRTVVHFIPSDTLLHKLREIDDGDGEECGTWPEAQD